MDQDIVGYKLIQAQKLSNLIWQMHFFVLVGFWIRTFTIYTKNWLVEICTFDKGVHAAMNLITAKLMVGLEEGDDEKFISRCNANLPETIRVLQLTIVTKSFNAQRHCAKRRYEYIMPTFMFRRYAAFLSRGWRYIPQNARDGIRRTRQLNVVAVRLYPSTLDVKMDGDAIDCFWRRNEKWLTLNSSKCSMDAKP